MKKTKTGFFGTLGKGIQSLFRFLSLLIQSLWNFIINNLGRIIKVLVTVWIMALLSILTVSLSYWLLGLGSKHFVETGETLQTLDMEGLLKKYPDIQMLLEDSLEVENIEE